MKFFIFLLLCSNSLLSQVWIQLADFPGSKRDDGVAVVVNDKLYVGSGLQEWNATIDFYCYDLSKQLWATLPGMSNTTERQYACAFAGNNSFYVFGGDGVGGALNTLYRFQTDSLTWRSMHAKPGAGLIGASCLNFGNKVIIAGGKTQTGQASSEVWEYTLNTDQWQQKNNFPFSGRWRSSAAVLQNKGYLVFGMDTASHYRNEFYSYDLLSDQWTKIMDLPFTPGRAYASLSAANSKLALFGGIDSLNTYYNDLWYYHPSNNNWIQGPDLPSFGRKGGMAAAYGESVFYTCGIRSGDQRLTESWMTHVPLSVQNNNTSESQAFRVFPNPAINYIQVVNNTSAPSPLYIEFCIRDVYGKEIVSQSKLNTDTIIPLDDIEGGLYLLSLYSENEIISVLKIIKH